MTSRANELTASPAPSALLAGIGTLTLWSGTPIANKVAVAYMDGITAGLLRSALAGGVAILVAMALRLPFPKLARDRMLLALSGIASFAAWPVAMSIGIEHTTAGHAALICATIPVIAVLLAAVIERRWPAAGWWTGAALALAGCVLLVAVQPDGVAASVDATLAGDAIVFVGGVLCAVGYVAGGRLSPRIGAASTTLWGLSLAMLVLVPLLLGVQSATEWSAVAAEGWLAMGWMSLLSSLAAYALWFYALGRGGIGRISSLLLVMPAITLLAAALVLGEPVGGLLLSCCALVIAGTYLAQRHAR